jgi:hypothetical protein
MTKEEIEAVEKEIEAREAEVVKTAAEESAGFDSVFSDEPPPTPEQVEALAEERKAAETLKAEEDAKAAEEAKKKEVVYANITPAELDDILKKANSVAEVREAMTKFQRDSAGRIGSLESTIKALQAQATTAVPLEVKAEDLVNFTKEFPELAPKLAEDLTKVLSRLKTAGEAPKGETPEEFTARVMPIVQAHVDNAQEAERKRLAPKILASRHKDYPTVIGAPDSNTEWRKWLKTQPGNYEERMLNSWDGFELADSLDTFKEHQRVELEKAEKAKKPAPKTPVPDARAQRLLEAVPARGGSIVRTKAEAKTEEDAFKEEIAKIPA